jgi:hypothetical protein
VVGWRTLDWWVKEMREWLGRVRGPDGINDGSALLIFVRRDRLACGNR